MASTRYRFYDYRGSSDYRYTATFTVNWEVSGNTIRITSINYNNDPNISGWYVASGMRVGVQWEGDSGATTIVDGEYNETYIDGELHYTVERGGAGFVTTSGVTGVFSAATSRCPVSKSFSGSKAGFKMWFGSTRGTINYGNPGPYRLVDYISGDKPEVELDYRPGERNVSGTWRSHNRNGGKAERIGYGEMKTKDGGNASGDPPERYNGGWKNQKKLGAE